MYLTVELFQQLTKGRRELNNGQLDEPVVWEFVSDDEGKTNGREGREDRKKGKDDKDPKKGKGPKDGEKDGKKDGKQRQN